jgi:hypothetical protein
MCSYSTEVGGVSSSLLGGECRLTVDSRLALTRHSTPDRRRVLPKSPSDTCRTWSGARAETVRCPTRAPSTKLDTRPALLRAYVRKSPAPLESAGSPPSRRGRRPKSTSRGGWRWRSGGRLVSRGIRASDRHRLERWRRKDHERGRSSHGSARSDLEATAASDDGSAQTRRERNSGVRSLVHVSSISVRGALDHLQIEDVLTSVRLGDIEIYIK